MFSDRQLLTEMPKLQRFSMRLTRNPTESEDLLQATLLRAIEKKDIFETGTNLFGWTSKIMFNLFLTNYKKSKYLSPYDPEIAINNFATPETQLEEMEMKEVSAAFDLLSKPHKEVIIRVCLEGQGYEEAAREMGVPIGTVRSRLSRAREELHHAC